MERLAERVEEVFEAGATIFEQGEQVQNRVLVVRRGTIELVDGSRVLDVLGEGADRIPRDAVGSAAGVRGARPRRTFCYSMAASDVNPLLARQSQACPIDKVVAPAAPAGAAAVKADVQQAGTAAGSGPDPSRAGDLRGGSPPSRGRPADVGGGVQLDVVVRAENGELGIVTDGDLLDQVVAEGYRLTPQWERSCRNALTTVGADAAGADVMLAMLDNDVHHVGVDLRGRG